MSVPDSRVIATIAMCCLVLVGCGTKSSAPTGNVTTTAPAVVTDYSARKLGSTETTKLSDLRGKPVFLNSWATWCVECRTELPDIQTMANTYAGRGLQVVGVNVDEGSDKGPVAFAQQHSLTFPMLHDEGHHYQVAFRAVGVPQSELISADGHLIKTWQGVFDPKDPDNVRLIESQLGNMTSSPT